VRCAPPANRPTGEEKAACRPWLHEEFRLLRRVEVIVCLGAVAYEEVLRLLRHLGHPVPRPRPGFAHGRWVETGGPAVVCSFHPSQQNTFTGRLTEDMLDGVFALARRRLDDEALGYGVGGQ
jgi:uracil-DNA glycosylase family 4